METDRAARRRMGRRAWWITAGIAVVVVLAVAGLLLLELSSSAVQSRWLSRYARSLTFAVEPGPNPAPPASEAGPYDLRLGYARLPDFLARAQAAGFRVEAQARLSAAHQGALEHGLFPIYREKTRAGLRIVGPGGGVLHEARYPARVFDRFEDVPPVIANTLVFVEDRHLLDPDWAGRNPAVNWARLGKAVGIRLLSAVGREGREIGASTLATQLEKFRHSPEGRTQSSREKLRQMATASVRAYRDGPDTTEVRRQLVVDYLNSMPLAAAPGVGEVNGLGDALWAWYGLDLATVRRALASPDAAAIGPGAGLTYRRVLSLILSARRPFHYLVEDRAALEALCDRYLRVLARAHVIGPALRDAALQARLGAAPSGAAAAAGFVERKGATFVRARLLAMLGGGPLYDLDRLDLGVESTVHPAAQEAVARILQSLRDPAAVAAAGLRAFRLLERGDPSRVLYSVTLYERGPGGNRVRVQTDSLDQPLDLNAGARLDLGSTAKLRTLISYLEAVAALHASHADRDVAALRATAVHRRDRLGTWAIEYLATAKDRSLPAMLEAALDRRFSGSPGAFFTGGGLQTFHNFDPEDDARIFTVRDGFRQSINLVFIRLMRDLVDHYLFRAPASIGSVLEDPEDPRREEFLTRFADREGTEFVRRFYRKYAGKSAEEALDMLVSGGRGAAPAVAALLRFVDPSADLDALSEALTARLPDTEVPERLLGELYDRYAPERYGIIDRGFIARVHPLELWLVRYLREHPDADLASVIQASAAERQEVYGWLFRTRHRHAQDQRIGGLLELEAFLDLHRGWQRLGYPFASLTPSLGTAIGSSGDRPAALAELMGIIVNDGVRYPTVLLERMVFGADTPYEARLVADPAEGRRVLAPEIAAAARRVLADVVERGTARSLGAALQQDGLPRHHVAGKTGTGDHRYETYGPGGRLIQSRVVSRAATFAFSIDDRFFGTITAYVPGPPAGQYEFTSALPVRLLQLLLPALAPVLDAPPLPATARAAAAR